MSSKATEHGLKRDPNVCGGPVNKITRYQQVHADKPEFYVEDDGKKIRAAYIDGCNLLCFNSEIPESDIPRFVDWLKEWYLDGGY